MKTTIKATQLEITTPLKEFIKTKIDSLDKNLGKLASKEEIIMKVEIARSTKHHNKGEVYYVELTLNIAKKILRIEQNGHDVREAIDIAKDRMKNEIEKLKGSLTSYKKVLSDKE